jgi:hypothetical protein
MTPRERSPGPTNENISNKQGNLGSAYQPQYGGYGYQGGEFTSQVFEMDRKVFSPIILDNEKRVFQAPSYNEKRVYSPNKGDDASENRLILKDELYSPSNGQLTYKAQETFSENTLAGIDQSKNYGEPTNNYSDPTLQRTAELLAEAKRLRERPLNAINAPNITEVSGYFGNGIKDTSFAGGASKPGLITSDLEPIENNPANYRRELNKEQKNFGEYQPVTVIQRDAPKVSVIEGPSRSRSPIRQENITYEQQQILADAANVRHLADFTTSDFSKAMARDFTQVDASNDFMRAPQSPSGSMKKINFKATKLSTRGIDETKKSFTEAELNNLRVQELTKIPQVKFSAGDEYPGKIL